jgi:hypothetical protein
MKALQQVKTIPPFAKTAKSGAPAKSKIQFQSDLFERIICKLRCRKQGKEG